MGLFKRIINKFRKDGSKNTDAELCDYASALAKGNELYDKEKYEEALNNFLKAEELGYDNSDLFFRISWVYRTQYEDYEKALKYADKCILADPDN